MAVINASFIVWPDPGIAPWRLLLRVPIGASPSLFYPLLYGLNIASFAALQRLRKETEGAADVLRFRVRDGLVGEHPVLVWKPCLQSRSPFLPFYQLSVGDSFVYYRVDGERFSKLTTRPA